MREPVPGMLVDGRPISFTHGGLFLVCSEEEHCLKSALQALCSYFQEKGGVFWVDTGPAQERPRLQREHFYAWWTRPDSVLRGCTPMLESGALDALVLSDVTSLLTEEDEVNGNHFASPTTVGSVVRGLTLKLRHPTTVLLGCKLQYRHDLAIWRVPCGNSVPTLAIAELWVHARTEGGAPGLPHTCHVRMKGSTRRPGVWSLR